MHPASTGRDYLQIQKSGKLEDFFAVERWQTFDDRLRNDKPVSLYPIYIKRTTCPVFTYRHHVAHERRVSRHQDKPAGRPLRVDCVRRRGSAHRHALAFAKRSADAYGTTGGAGGSSGPLDRASGSCRCARASSAQGSRACRASQGLATNTPLAAAATGAAPATSCRTTLGVACFTCRT